MEATDIFVEVFGRTDVGRQREHNEDTFVVANLDTGARTLGPSVRRHVLGPAGTLLAVCDGMGGASAGEVASQIGADTLFEVMSRRPLADTIPTAVQRLGAAFQEANDRIAAAARRNLSRRGMGTTCSAALLFGPRVLTAQVGDSRVYVVRGDRIRQATRDQSLLNHLRETGHLKDEDLADFQHANVILQALGVVSTVQTEFGLVELCQGDRILVCSDGLTGVVEDEEIADEVGGNRDLVTACKRLTALANERGGPDNVTVVLAEVRGPGVPAERNGPLEVLRLDPRTGSPQGPLRTGP